MIGADPLLENHWSRRVMMAVMVAMIAGGRVKNLLLEKEMAVMEGGRVKNLLQMNSQHALSIWCQNKINQTTMARDGRQS